MLIFDKLFYKNFQSVGEMGITIELGRHPTTLIGGDNGSGKSTMLEALVYCLYGKTMKPVKLAGVINSVNKKGLVTSVTFSTNGKKYTVLRGQKPAKFEIWEEDAQLDKDAKASDLQKRLEDILGMDYRLFVQLVVLNTVKYTPFMELEAKDRRHVVENILDIGVFAEMNRLAKEHAKELGFKIDDLDYRRGILKEKINSQDRLIEQAKEAAKDRQSEIQEMIDEWRIKEAGNQTKLDAVKEQIKEATDPGEIPDATPINTDLQGYVKDAERVQKEIKFYQDNDSCPTCEQTLENGFRQDSIEKGNRELEALREKATQAVKEKKAVEKARDDALAQKERMAELVREYKSLTRAVGECKYQIKALEAKLNETVEDKTQEHVEKRQELVSELQEADTRMDALLNEKAAYMDAQTALKDDGIKSNIVSDYIDYINQKVNEYLQEMGFFVNIVLDENFKESVASINRDGFVYHNFSKGQQCRINLAIWLALLEVASVKNSVVTNVLFLDEILENLDADGVNLFMKLVNNKMAHKNVFVVTQRFDEFKDYFRSDIRFRLDNGFTVIE